MTRRWTWLSIALLLASATRAGSPDWIDPLREVHSRFHGTSGTLLQIGDSITVTQAYWTPLLYGPRGLSGEGERALALVKGSLRPECWRDWKGPEFGSDGGKTVAWALERVDGWLEKLRPEAAIILLGTNDLHQIDAARYEREMRQLVEKCLERGVVAILTTIPPRAGMLPRAKEFAEAVRRIGRDLHLPVIDLFEEILRRRPDDWDGSSEKFRTAPGDEYQVPTLIARDGVHPSNPSRFAGDFSQEALRQSGYGLRTHLSLLAYAEVVRTVLRPEKGDAAPARSPSPPGLPWLPRAPVWPPPEGAVIRVATVEELFRAAEEVRPGGTILLADGQYPMPSYFAIHTDRVTVRGASGDRTKVILDGSKSQDGELFGFDHCSDVTVADLTIQNIKWNGFKINSDRGARRITIHNCAIRNIWQRGVKGPHSPEVGALECRVEYCLFENDRPKRFEDDPTDTPQTFNGNYLGGIDSMDARGWVIQGNVFHGLRGRTGEARGAVFLWVESRDCVVERNVFLDCDQGICLGNAHKEAATEAHARNMIVRNNFVAGAREGGISACYSRGCRILHNTIHDPGGSRSIRIIRENDGLLVERNLIFGAPIALETQTPAAGTPARVEGNVQLGAEGAKQFVAPAAGDLHLRARIPHAAESPESKDPVTEDFDGDPRGERPDPGADQLQGG